MDVLVRNPIAANVLDMILSFSLLLALSSAFPTQIYGVLLFIGLFSLAISSICVALIVSNLHTQVAKFRIFQAFSPIGVVQWKHLQFTYSLALSSFNFISFLANMAIASSVLPHQAYSAAGFFSLALSLSFLLTALISLHDMSDQEDLDQKSRLVQQQKPGQYSQI